MKQDFTVIPSAVENCLYFVGNHLRGLIHTVYTVPDYMIDYTRRTQTNDWCHWKPLDADISEVDFKSYEKQTGIRLPASYKAFLSYKHFIELNFGHEICFFKHTKNWIGDNLESIDQWGTAFTTEKGLLTFAFYSDWGLVCFDGNGIYEDNEYNIVYLDHEDIHTPKEYAHARFTFIDLITEMNQRLNEWKQETEHNKGTTQ
jgi:hypothetical protein